MALIKLRGTTFETKLLEVRYMSRLIVFFFSFFFSFFLSHLGSPKSIFKPTIQTCVASPSPNSPMTVGHNNSLRPTLIPKLTVHVGRTNFQPTLNLCWKLT